MRTYIDAQHIDPMRAIASETASFCRNNIHHSSLHLQQGERHATPPACNNMCVPPCHLRALKCCVNKSSTRAVNLVLVLAVPVPPSVMETSVRGGNGGSSHRGRCRGSRHCGTGSVGGCGAVEGDHAADGHTVAVGLTDDGLKSGRWAYELRERHEVTLAQEGKEVVSHVGGRRQLIDEHVLEAGEERGTDKDHVVAVRDKRTGYTGGVDGGGSRARDNGLVDTKTVSICLVW